jgi:beta-lactamase regulating signal transducer with metallopeptidase domain
VNHLAAIAAAALIAAIWQGAILAAVVALTLRLLPAISAATRSIIWTATFALLIALHFLPAIHPSSEVAATASAHPLHLAATWSIALGILWLTLSLFRATQFLLSAHRLHQINRRAVPITAGIADNIRHSERSEDPLYFALAEPQIATTRPYTLCSSPDVDRPSVLGFFHPRILLPAGLLETLTPAELHQILLHETEHLRRSDDWTNLLQKLALVLFPLNPVLFWVERRLCLERELACDARVLSAGENLRKSYATTLTRLAEHSILRRGLNLALGILGQRPRPSELSTRVHRILSRPAKNLTRSQTRLATATVLAGLLTLSTALAHAPSLITFTPQATPEQATNLGVPSLTSESWAPKLVPAKAVVQRAAQPSYRTVETVAHIPVAPSHRLNRTHTIQHPNATPHLFNTTYRAPRHEVDQQPRLTLTVASGSQVQQFVVPAVAYVPAYAAFRTPDGWIIFQL